MAKVIRAQEEEMPEEARCAWLHVGTASPPSQAVLIAMFSLGI